MRNWLIRVIPPSLGGSIGAMIFAALRNYTIWKSSDYILNFLVFFVITTIFVSVYFCLWTIIKRTKKRDK